ITKRPINMALKPGSLIKVNEFLSANDYSQSPNLLFFAIMQADGNFCVHRGTGPSDRHGWVWGSQQLAPGGQFFAIMQDDGNFCVYKGTGPSDSHGWVWATGTMKTMDPNSSTYKQREILTATAKKIFKDDCGIDLPDDADCLRLAEHQPLVFGFNRKNISTFVESLFMSFKENVTNRTSPGGPGLDKETIDRLMDVVEIIKGPIITQVTGAHFCSARVKELIIASLAVLLDVDLEDYLGIESDLLIAIKLVVFRPKTKKTLALFTEVPKYKYIPVKCFD